MFPLPRMLEYGNHAPIQWYNENDVISAFDGVNFKKSTGFGTDGFTDYKNINYQADAQNAGLLPDLADSTNSIMNQFGSYGIILYGSALSANNRQIPASYMNSDYTVDFWMRNQSSGIASANLLEMVPFMWVDAIVSNTNKWCLWANFRDATGARWQYGSTNTIRPKASYAPMWADTKWNHFGYTFVKSTNTHYIFVNGILVDSFVLAIPALGSAKFGVCGHVNSQSSTGGNPPHTSIDRFRFRNRAVWTSNFDPKYIYP